MSDRIVLRKVYAVDSNTGLTMEPGNVLTTNTNGGTTWTPMLTVLRDTGGSIIGNLPSTISSFSTIVYNNTTLLGNISTTYLAAICSLRSVLDNTIGTDFINGLGTTGYISSSTLFAELSSLKGSPNTVSSMAGSLSSLGFVNLSTLSSFQSDQFKSTMSTVVGLGSIGYISSLSLTSTVAGLGSIGYISSLNTPISFISTVDGLGQFYVSSSKLDFAINRLGTDGYVSTTGLTSTVAGLGNIGYISTASLCSTTAGLIASEKNIRFDNVTSLSIIGGNNTNIFSSITNLIYISTFFQSSIRYSGAQSGVQIQGKVDGINMEFSTAVLRMDSFSSFINEKSRVTIEIYPLIAFSKLATSSRNVAIIPISTLLKYGTTNVIKESVTTSYLYAGNTTTTLETTTAPTTVNSSNIFNQTIRLSIPQGTFVDRLGPNNSLRSNYTFDYTLYHYMPTSVNNAGLPTALSSSDLTPYFGPTGSLFVSVQNSV